MNKARNEIRVTLYRDKLIVMSALANAESPNPPGSGKRASIGLSSKQRTRIRRAVESMEGTGPTWFVTLTYPPGNVPKKQISDCRGEWGELVNVVEDKTAKRHLSVWLRRLRRAYSDVRYVWVAEIQPERLANRLERAIHFHLVINVNISRDWLDASWSDVIGQRAYPNVQKVRKSASGYLAKYMTKRQQDTPSEWEVLTGYIEGNRCGIDQQTSELLKPIGWGVVPGGNWADVARCFEPETANARIGSAREWLGVFWGFKCPKTPTVPYLLSNGNHQNSRGRDAGYRGLGNSGV